MSDFFDTDENDLVEHEDLVFGDNEVVKMQVLDHKQIVDKGLLILTVKVHSGPHNGKETSLFIKRGDNPAARKVRVQFLKAFWSENQIKNRDCNPASIMGRFFTVRSKVRSGNDGRVFQNWEQFTPTDDAPKAQASGGRPNVAGQY